MFGQAASVNNISQNVLENGLSTEVKLMARGNQNFSVTRRVLISFPSLRINFGISNYIERTTPLNFAMFVLLRIVDMMLLERIR